MEFKEFRQELIKHFDVMTEDAKELFEVQVDKDEMWNLYLDSFPAGTNKMFRKRREYDCSCCRQFIKNIGNAVVIKDNKIETIWDLNLGDNTFQPVVDALSAFIKSKPVTDIYKSREKKVGTEYNFEQWEDGTMKRWDHFMIKLPNKFVNNTSRSLGDIKGDFRDVRNVFKRSLDEISLDAVDTVLELIAQNSLYKGEEWKHVLTEFKKYKKAYDKLSVDDKDNYAWEQSLNAGPVIGKIRNHSMGVLLINISENMNLEEAVKKYEVIVAPSNYKRSKAIFTKKMLEDAKKTITELGYLDSLKRRFATLDDISVNNILFSNKDAAKRIPDANDIFGEMEKDVSVNPKKFSRVDEVYADDFVNNILPTAKEVELLLENRHANNMVSLIAPQNSDAKTMFKWNNGFSWAYAGNMTDSMKDRVKAAGGKVDGDLRFSIQWNDIDTGSDNSDLDAHCKTPVDHIYFRNKLSYTRGNLDVDITHPENKIAVENITWANRQNMMEGTYTFYVNQYFNRNHENGFRAEIEFDGQVYSFDYSKSMRTGEDVYVAEVTLKDGKFTIKELLPSSTTSRDVWGLQTNQFVPVSVICYSPNYWDQQNGVGHRHYFFMLKDCVNPEKPNAFYNEFLKEDLMKHRKVFEALGAKAHVEDCDDQLSGVGFSATKHDEVLVKVKGATERVIKVKF